MAPLSLLPLNHIICGVQKLGQSLMIVLCLERLPDCLLGIDLSPPSLSYFSPSLESWSMVGDEKVRGQTEKKGHVPNVSARTHWDES